MRSTALQFMRVSVALALVAVSSGACSHVAPYQRGRLAHPTMTGSELGAGEAHVYAVQEGATGGGTVAESGCGCN